LTQLKIRSSILQEIEVAATARLDFQSPPRSDLKRLGPGKLVAERVARLSDFRLTDQLYRHPWEAGVRSGRVSAGEEQLGLPSSNLVACLQLSEMGSGPIHKCTVGTPQIAQRDDINLQHQLKVVPGGFPIEQLNVVCGRAAKGRRTTAEDNLCPALSSALDVTRCIHDV
jgi:hypothetical protein